MSLFHAVLALNAIFFLFYGIQCFRSPVMAADFKRFNLPDSQRVLTGVLQLLGSAGLIVGLAVPVIGGLASGGLALMMLAAFIIRLKVRDGVIESAPSLIFLAINTWLSYSFYNLMQSGFTGVQ
jgi:hypothetical protein